MSKTKITMSNEEALDELYRLLSDFDWLSTIQNSPQRERFKQALNRAINLLKIEIDKEKRENFEFNHKVGDPAEMLVDGVWHQGRIFKGYRYHDGIVTIITEDGHKYWCGQDRTELYRPL